MTTASRERPAITTSGRFRRDEDHRYRYIVAGPAGAIEYHGFHGMSEPIGIGHHSPRPRCEGDEPSRCEILEGPCYPDGAREWAIILHRQWLEGDRDDEVIWRELERRYAEMAEGAGQ